MQVSYQSAAAEVLVAYHKTCFASALATSVGSRKGQTHACDCIKPSECMGSCFAGLVACGQSFTSILLT